MNQVLPSSNYPDQSARTAALKERVIKGNQALWDAALKERTLPDEPGKKLALQIFERSKALNQLCRELHYLDYRQCLYTDGRQCASENWMCFSCPARMNPEYIDAK